MRSKQDCDCSAPEAKQKAIDSETTPQRVSNLHFKHLFFCFHPDVDGGGEKYSVSMRGK